MKIWDVTKEAGIVGYDGHFCAVVARLVKYSLLKLYKYVRILFESGVKVPVVTLWLGGGAMDPLGSLLPFLLRVDRLLSIKNDLGRGVKWWDWILPS